MKNYNSSNKKIIIKINIKHIILLLIFILSIMLLFYAKIVHTRIVNYKFSMQTEKFKQDNEEPIFKVNKILLYSSAGAIDNSTGEVLQDLDISQYTDISINIESKKQNNELTDINTVKQLYIDNINIQINSDKGERILNYKNPYLSGKYRMLNNCENGRIDFKIVNTNQENDEANYDEPIFYTDCSNPISLGYLNKNIVQGYCVSEAENSVSFDGKLLKNARANLDEINCKISFQIHLINNKNEKFICPIIIENNVDNDKDEIYNGYVLKVQNTDDKKYNFIQSN